MNLVSFQRFKQLVSGNIIMFGILSWTQVTCIFTNSNTEYWSRNIFLLLIQLWNFTHGKIFAACSMVVNCHGEACGTWRECYWHLKSLSAMTCLQKLIQHVRPLSTALIIFWYLYHYFTSFDEKQFLKLRNPHHLWNPWATRVVNINERHGAKCSIFVWNNELSMGK